MLLNTLLPFILVLGHLVLVEPVEVKVVITPGDLRLGVENGHIREIGLLVHDVAIDDIALMSVKIFEDESQTKLLTEFPLQNKIVERLNQSVRVLSGLRVQPFNFTREETISGCLDFHTVIYSLKTAVVEELAKGCLNVNSDWMTKQMDKIGTLPFLNVSFPGCHDAGSYETFDKVANVVEYYIYSQEEDIFNQLMYGARFFDLRIGFTPSNGPDISDWFYIVHGAYITANKVKTVFDDVKAFLELYPDEIVLLDMHRFPVGAWDEGTFALFAGFIETELGPLIIRANPSQKTLKEVVETGSRVLITWNDASSQRYFGGVENVWANSDKMLPLYHYFKENLHLASREGWLYSAMAELTPQGFWNIVLDTYGGGLRGLADKHNFETMLWFRNDLDIRSNSTIIAVDFFTSTDVADICAEINLERARSFPRV